MNSLVKFYYGTQLEYDAALQAKTIDSDNLYFILSSDNKLGKIYKGEYDVTDDVIKLSDIPAIGEKGKIYISDQWDENSSLYDARFWDGSAFVPIIHHLTDDEILAQYQGATIPDPVTTQPTHPIPFTPNERSKLAGIASGAEVNVQSDWNQTNNQSDDFIKNKPVITASATDIVNNGTKIPNASAIFNKLKDYIPTSGSNATIKTLYEANANTNCLTDALLEKLNGIAAGAEVNVQADWTETNNSLDSYIKHKPIIDKSNFTTTDDNHFPTSKLVNTTLLNNYLNRNGGSLTGPMYAANQNIYMGSNTNSAYMKYNSNTGGFDFFTV